MAPKFADNIILTKTERLMMSNRPPDPKNARNKNVLVVGGSGSGKTRFWLKPNLLQCHSSYVVTDPKLPLGFINHKYAVKVCGGFYQAWLDGIAQPVLGGLVNYLEWRQGLHSRQRSPSGAGGGKA